METVYNYNKVQFQFYDEAYKELQKLGDQGWEVIDTKRVYVRDHFEEEFLLRRPVIWQPGIDSWEYHNFYASHSLPYSFWSGSFMNHLLSCGWENIMEFGGGYYSVVAVIWAKRPGVWRGKDDGDVIARLQDLGYVHLKGGSCLEGYCIDCIKKCDVAIPQILETKYIQSEKRGYNIGTYEATRYWLTHDYLPSLFREFGEAMASCPFEQLLDELLSLRQTLKKESTPALKEVLGVWLRSSSRR